MTRRTRWWVGASLAAALLAAVTVARIGVTPTPPSVTVTALRYGHGPYPARLVQEGATGDIELCWAFYLLTWGDRAVLVDTGVGSEEARETYRIEGYLPPDRVLAEAGLEVTAIDDVILTHTHADHAGGLDRFPRARVHLQRQAYERLRFAGDRLWTMLRAVEEEGRLRLLDGPAELWPGVSVEPSGGHTRGSQAVRVTGAHSTFVIVGDECYFERACLAGTPLPGEALADPDAHRAFLRRLEGWWNEGARPLTFHDPAPAGVPRCDEARVVSYDRPAAGEHARRDDTAR